MPVLDVGDPAPLPGECGGPWVETTDVPSLSSLSPADQTLIVTAASRLLYEATAEQYTGICRDVVRPPSVNCVGATIPPHTRLSDGSLWLGAPGVAGLTPWSWESTVRLPGYPIVEIVRVTIDGTDLPAGSWLISENRDVVRANGASWPAWQRLDRPAGSEDTWTIEYRWGVGIPPDGVLAARVLSAELGKSLQGDQTCRLPKRLQTVTREGLTAVIMDPRAALNEWWEFGIYECDQFVSKANPGHLREDGKVINVDLIDTVPRHIR